MDAEKRIRSVRPFVQNFFMKTDGKLGKEIKATGCNTCSKLVSLGHEIEIEKLKEKRCVQMDQTRLKLE